MHLALFAGVVFSLRVPSELVPVEVHLAQVPRCITSGLVVEVLRLRVTTLAARRDRACPHAVAAKLHHRDEAVSAGAIPFLRSVARRCAERRQGSIRRRRMDPWRRAALRRTTPGIHTSPT